MKNEEQRSKPYRGTRRRLQMAAGDEVFIVHMLGVRFDSNHRLLLPSTTIKSIMTGGVSTVDLLNPMSLRPSIIRRQRSQLSAALTLIPQLSNKSKCISTNPFASGNNTTTSLPKPSKGVHSVVYAVYEENPFTNVTRSRLFRHDVSLEFVGVTKKNRTGLDGCTLQR
eukprot:scaffold9767_cov147-Skeletonema_marinoi.AAC.2